MKRMGVQCADKLEHILKKLSIIQTDKELEKKNMLDYGIMYDKLLNQYC